MGGQHRRQGEPFLTSEGPSPATMVNNLDWTAPCPRWTPPRRRQALPVNQMLPRGVCARLNSRRGISYTEFSYQLLQWLDYLTLPGPRPRVADRRQRPVGRPRPADLIRGSRGRVALQLPTRSPPRSSPSPTGRSSARPPSRCGVAGPQLTSPYAFYQYWLNVDDADVAPFCSFTFRTRDEIEDLEAQVGQRGRRPRAGQRVLAEDLTTLEQRGRRAGGGPAGGPGLVRARATLAALPLGALEAALREAGLVAAEPGGHHRGVLVGDRARGEQGRRPPHGG